MEKMDNMQEQMGNVSRQMEMLRIRSKCQKSKTEMKKGFDGLIRRLDMTKKIIYELEDMSIETSKTEKQREKVRKREHCFQNWETTTKGITCG